MRGSTRASSPPGWLPPGTTVHVHTLDPREGGAFQITVTDDAPSARTMACRGVAPVDHELGWRMALDRIAALVEAPRSQPRP